MTATYETSRHDDTAGEIAARRAAELHALNERLKVGDALTSCDVEAAADRAQQAHTRSRLAHLAAADRHVCAAEAHERAAETHRRAAEAGVGDMATHWRAVAIHEAASEDDYHAAELARRLARD